MAKVARKAGVTRRTSRVEEISDPTNGGAVAVGVYGRRNLSFSRISRLQEVYAEGFETRHGVHVDSLDVNVHVGRGTDTVN